MGWGGREGVWLTQCPGEEESEDEGDGDEVHAPFRPFVFFGVGEEGHGEETDEGRDAGCGHDPHASVGDSAGVDADDDEDEDGHDGSGYFDEEDLEFGEAEVVHDDGAESREAAVKDC